MTVVGKRRTVKTRRRRLNSLESPVPFGLEASHSRTTMTMTTKHVKEVTSIIGLTGRKSHL